MAQNNKKSLKIILGSFLTLAIIFAILLVWLYTGALTPAKIKIFQYSFLPMAMVNGQPVPIKNYIARQALAEKFLAGSVDKQAVTNQLVFEEEVRQLDSRFGVYVPQKQVDAEYSSHQVADDPNKFEEWLLSYGLSPQSYKDQVIRPNLQLINLQIWFNGQQQGNSAAYDQASQLMQNIQKGADFLSLAADANQDAQMKNLKGDMGFVQVSDLLPELQETVDGMKPGEVKLVPSRLGLNIIKLEDKVGNNLHLRQIFLPGGDFNSWFNSQIKNFKIKTLI